MVAHNAWGENVTPLWDVNPSKKPAYNGETSAHDGGGNPVGSSHSLDYDCPVETDPKGEIQFMWLETV